jgi:hypothetical protein
MSSEIPGESSTIRTKILNFGSCMMENFTPLKSVCEHIIGFHSYSDDFSRFVPGYHFCMMLNEDIRQCMIFDSNSPNAKLIGIEYLISEKLFQTLPDEEKLYWHTQVHEIKTGLLTCPNVPEVAEKEIMKKLMNTYGKTIQFWQFDKDSLPLGPPKMMMTTMSDKQIDWNVVKERDKINNVDTLAIAESRKDLKETKMDPMADAWFNQGKVYTIVSKIVDTEKLKNKLT